MHQGFPTGCGPVSIAAVCGFHLTFASTNPAPEIELDSLLLEEPPLRKLGARPRAEAHSTGGIDHAMPGKRRGVGKGVQRVPHLARVPGQPRELGHLAVGGDAPARNAPHHGVDARVAAGAGGERAHTGNVRSAGYDAKGTRTDESS